MCRASLTIVLIAMLTPLALAQAPTTLPTTQPLSGKLGTPIELFNGKDFTGWSWFSPSERREAGANLVRCRWRDAHDWQAQWIPPNRQGLRSKLRSHR